jgi:hypothetical protein
MSVSTSTLYSSGQVFHTLENQGSVYMGYSYTGSLGFAYAYRMPTPIGESMVSFTQPNAAYVSNFFMGTADGFWIHRVWNEGNFVGTFQMVNQKFSIPVKFDHIESVSMPFVDNVCGRGHGGGDCPSPSGAAILIMSAFLTKFRSRKQ